MLALKSRDVAQCVIVAYLELIPRMYAYMVLEMSLSHEATVTHGTPGGENKAIHSVKHGCTLGSFLVSLYSAANE